MSITCNTYLAIHDNLCLLGHLLMCMNYADHMDLDQIYGSSLISVHSVCFHDKVSQECISIYEPQHVICNKLAF